MPKVSFFHMASLSNSQILNRARNRHPRSWAISTRLGRNAQTTKAGGPPLLRSPGITLNPAGLFRLSSREQPSTAARQAWSSRCCLYSLDLPCLPRAWPLPLTRECRAGGDGQAAPRIALLPHGQAPVLPIGLSRLTQTPQLPALKTASRFSHPHFFPGPRSIQKSP